MLLTSLDRVRAYVGLTDSAANNRDLVTWIAVCSRKVENFLDRPVEKIVRTEYFDIGYGKREYMLQAYPVSSITSVKVDSEGQFTGDETTLDSDEYHIGTDSRSMVLEFPEVEDLREMQVVYTGGLATHGTRSVFSTSSVTGTWNESKYVVGSTTHSVGIVRTVSGTDTLTIENLYGAFEDGETLTEYDSETAQGSSTATAVIESIVSQSLAEAYPDITRAVEMEVRYCWKHKNDFENVGTNKDSTSRKSSSSLANFDLTDEAMALLEPYRRLL